MFFFCFKEASRELASTQQGQNRNIEASEEVANQNRKSKKNAQNLYFKLTITELLA